MKKLLFLAATLICFSFHRKNADDYVTQNASVSFVSSANFEKISAKSTSLTGTLDIHKRTFSFTVPICSFDGFLNGSQKKHYCNNYVEGEKFPNSTFKGKVIEEFDLSVPGTYNVRCKGLLLLHGIEKEIIINTVVVVKDGNISATSKFAIVLEDHGMKISRVNTLVISKTVDVEVKLTLIPS